MKKIVTILAVLCMLIYITGCSQKDIKKNTSKINNINNTTNTTNINLNNSYSGAPKIVIDGKDYYATDLEILDSLPEGYEKIGVLTKEEIKYAFIDESEYYADLRHEGLRDFYVYQECGTPISENLVDNTKRQMAYVHWTIKD